MITKLKIIAVFLLVLLPVTGCRLFTTPTNTPSSQTATPKLLTPSGGGLLEGATATQQKGLVTAPAVTAAAKETPAPTLQTTAGEIPEEQTFMYYSSTTGHYDVQAPEGWTSTADGDNIKFTHNYDGMMVQVSNSSDPFTVDSIRSTQVAALISSGRAVVVTNISMVTTKSGKAILVEYGSNSDPAAGKKIRLENRLYYFATTGRLAALTLWAPAGANNTNVWKQIPDTFVWR